MTPAELARDNAISFECKKDALQQRQSGDWKISFTVQGVDMDQRLTRAAMGTRFVAVLVEVNDQELPVNQPAKENESDRRLTPAAPQPTSAPAGAARLSMIAAIRCGDPIFRAFLHEGCGFDTHNKEDAAVVVRQLCRVESRKEFDADPLAALRWHSLNEQYLAWEAKERVGA